eukprot:TRINITY_DN121625_c0_g1_i1.p1 TRINITY_DN121625_c0_g1~~TRINITY_DN121625_c0_g1_i1.p1  ORF type:complete len:606 (-),score=123.62 TRINITY_DN121625_c0_g1_i1:146-1963(-)
MATANGLKGRAVLPATSISRPAAGGYTVMPTANGVSSSVRLAAPGSAAVVMPQTSSTVAKGALIRQGTMTATTNGVSAVSPMVVPRAVASTNSITRAYPSQAAAPSQARLAAPVRRSEGVKVISAAEVPLRTSVVRSSVQRLTPKKEKVAVMGGAFDPPTMNHLLGAAEVIHSGMADQVWVMPCGPRPDKPHLSAPIDRYIMTQLAVNTFFSADLPVYASDFEVMEPEAFATYDSLTGLSKKYPHLEFSFVIGTDWLQPGTDLREWTSKCPKTGEQIVTGDKLIAEYDFLVIQRPGYDVEDMKTFGPRMLRLEMPEGVALMQGNLSSTEIRKRADTSFRVNGTPELIEGLVPPAVLSYINMRSLYQKGSMSIPGAPVHKRNVAVFGGAFDPPTSSHMLGLAEIVHSGIADEALLVPCGPRPDKPHLNPPLARYTMCQLACNSTFSYKMPVRASDIEVFEPEALATYDSLRALQEQEPGANFKFVIGTDWLQPGTDIRQWTSKCPVTGEQIVTGDRLLEEFDFIVIKRPGYEVDDLASFGPRMQWMEMPHGMKTLDSNLSSTEVRKRAKINYTGKAPKAPLQLVDGLVPPGVFNYIRREKVYEPKS